MFRPDECLYDWRDELMKTTIKAANFEFSFTDEDIIDIDDVMFADDYNPHNHKMFLLHDAGFTLCVVCAESLQDAIDIAADNDKLDRYNVTDDAKEDYGGDICNCDRLAYLGNACLPYDIESLGYVEFPLPKKSIVRLYGEEINAISYRV